MKLKRRKNMNIDLNTCTFDELAEHATIKIHSALLKGGGKEMETAVYTWMTKAIEFEKIKHDQKNIDNFETKLSNEYYSNKTTELLKTMNFWEVVAWYFKTRKVSKKEAYAYVKNVLDNQPTM
jgi:hypothetical protein